jgi:hypothetical protein
MGACSHAAEREVFLRRSLPGNRRSGYAHMLAYTSRHFVYLIRFCSS